MARRASGHSIPLLDEPGTAPGAPQYLRLYRRYREGILQGAIAPGTRLPSSRTIARDERLSRNTVEAALGQLQAEGFVVRRVGAGTWVSERIPQRPVRPARFRQTDVPASAGRRTHTDAPRLSAWGRYIATARADDETESGLIFAPCVPGYDALPLDAWNRLSARIVRRAPGSLLMPPPAAGLPVLREAIAAYVSMQRGVRCTADLVVVLNSTQQGIDLVARLLLEPGERIWLEDPGYISARHAFASTGARIVPVPVDDDGIDVARGVALASDARLACVTPSHQYPLGVTLSLARRLALLEWAEGEGSWILEDDYDSELRYDGRPHACMQGIDSAERVIYAGTFNKILFPTVRVAYLVLPPALVAPFARARVLTDGFVPPVTQRVLAEFISEGYFSIHLRRVRALYQERRDAFLAAAAAYLPDHVTVGPSSAGMHVALGLPADVDDVAVSLAARRRGIAAPALSDHCLDRVQKGLLVHYGNAPVPLIARAVHMLAE